MWHIFISEIYTVSQSNHYYSCPPTPFRLIVLVYVCMGIYSITVIIPPLVHFKPHTISVLMFGYLTAVFYWTILSDYTYALVFNNNSLLIKIYTRYY